MNKNSLDFIAIVNCPLVHKLSFYYFLDYNKIALVCGIKVNDPIVLMESLTGNKSVIK